MCAYIGIEDLAANALIEILGKDKEDKFVSYETLENYGLEVVKILTEKKEDVVLILSREETRKMLREYSDIFVESFHNEKWGIELKESVTVSELISKFRGYLSFEVLLAFMAESSKRKLWK